MPTPEQLLLWAIVVAGISVTAARYRPASIVTVATIGLLVYSVPAFVGLSQPLSAGNDGTMVPTSGPAVVAVAIAWLAYVGVILWPGRRESGGPDTSSGGAVSGELARRFLIITAVLAVAITALLAAQHGPLFFLIDRAEISPRLGNEYLIWKWLNVLGLIGSFATRRWGLFALFAVLVGVNLVVGDRTGPVIAMAAVGLLVVRRHTWRSALSDPRVIGIAALTLGIVFFAKRLYVSLKSPELGLGYAFDPAFALNPVEWLTYWEPFAIHQILEDVIGAGLHIEPLTVIVPSLAQLLVVPSAFGIDSGVFNEILTATLYPDLNFGVGYNYLAQGHAVAGLLGVALYGALFGAAARLVDRWRRAASDPWAWLWVLIGVIVAVYVHRNSIENELAIVRQAVIAFGVAYLPAFLLAPRRRPTRPLTQRIQLDAAERPLLSVCIPTLNRRDRAARLVRELLSASIEVEVGVHVAGSTDGTHELLATLDVDRDRLRLTADRHRGRAYAMRRALASATGHYAMFFDDDDDIDAPGLRSALDHLRGGSPPGYCGSVFHLRDEAGEVLGSPFARRATNSLEMRLDDGVRGGKREIVLTNLLKEVVNAETRPAVGRWPTSLLWSTLALDHDIETVDESVGITRQLPTGMSSRIIHLKVANPRPMYDLYRTMLRGYQLGRFRSRRALVTVALKAAAYGSLALVHEPLAAIARRASEPFRKAPV